MGFGSALMGQVAIRLRSGDINVVIALSSSNELAVATWWPTPSPTYRRRVHPKRDSKAAFSKAARRPTSPTCA